MTPQGHFTFTARWLGALAALCALGAVLVTRASPASAQTPAPTQPAAALRAQHQSLREALSGSPFQRPLVLNSAQSPEELTGDVYAVIDQPFHVTRAALHDKARWCDVLILHLNVKDCRAPADSERLSVVIGRKFDRSADGGQAMEFSFRVPVAEADYLRVQMAADSGPMATRDHRLVLEAAPLDERRSFVHLTYAYGFGTMARLATQAYLATAGRDKVGFTVVRRTTDGRPVYIDGVRGMVERNVMRYYLAIEAYLGAVQAPPGERTEKRLRDWFTATERSPAQLHEMDRDEYLAMKREHLRRTQ